MVTMQQDRAGTLHIFKYHASLTGDTLNPMRQDGTEADLILYSDIDINCILSQLPRRVKRSLNDNYIIGHDIDLNLPNYNNIIQQDEWQGSIEQWVVENNFQEGVLPLCMEDINAVLSLGINESTQVGLFTIKRIA